MLIRNFKYRPEVDGLRAIAVMAVVLFHARLGVSGGYIGVDVFFVISGYLITSLIIKDLEAGTFSFWKFWERRIRRILPALTVMILSVLALGWFLLLPNDYANLGKSTVWQALFAANIYFWRNSGYFSPAAEEQPLLHTWSLAVEEQFYFLMPVGLFILFRCAFFRRRPILLTLLTIGTLLSLALSIYGISHHHFSATFYLLPTRAWELMLGSILAIAPTRIIPSSQWGREIMSCVGIVGILIPCFFYNADTPFPGLAALPVCLGSFLYILSNQHNPQNQPLTQVGKLLASRPFVFIGLISYSLYLWHWPLFAFNTYWSDGTSNIQGNITLVLLAFVLAILSWRYIETPFRLQQLASSRRKIYALGLSSIMLLLVVGYTAYYFNGFPLRLPSSTEQILAAKNDHNIKLPFIATKDIKANNIIRVGSPSAPQSVLLWGDSHARMLIPAFELLANEYSISVAVIGYPSSLPILPVAGNYRTSTSVPDTEEWAQAAIQYIREHHIQDTFLAAYWGYSKYDLHNKQEFSKDLLATIQAIQDAGSRVWIIHQVPDHNYKIPEFLVREGFRPQFLNWLRGEPKQASRTRIEHQKILSLLELDPVPNRCTFLDPSVLFLSNNPTRDFDISRENIVFYRDNNHLTLSAVRGLVYPWLTQTLKEHRFRESLRPIHQVTTSHRPVSP
jgi:peptidoglycan/LPS O-acetylase OafA/YrhL